jgi:hypothetical protein
MTLIIDLPEDLEAAIRMHAQAEGVDEAGYARRVLERALRTSLDRPGPPLKTGRGLLAGYGPAPSADEIDANRADMFRGFGENVP